MTTLTEKIAVMQAAERGKKIQFRKLVSTVWRDTECYGWNWEYYDFRVKVREWWDVVSLDGEVVFSRHHNVVGAQVACDRKESDTSQVIHVREVTDG